MLKKSLEQENIFEEIKNGTGNLLINAKAGTGKCLGKNTNIIKFDGSKEKVQNIKSGDLLMGDDGTPRTVLSTSVGRGKLYKVFIPYTKEYFICNGDHILTCTKDKDKIVPIDISIDDILKDTPILERLNVFHNIFLYRYNASFENNIKLDDELYYNIGCNFFKKLQRYNKIIGLPIKYRQLIISGIIDTYTFPQKSLFRMNFPKAKDNTIFLSLLRSCLFHFDTRSDSIFGDFSKLSLRNTDFEGYYDKKNIITINKGNIFKFRIEEYQKEGDYYGFTLDGNGRFLVNDFIVTHNTTTIVNSLDIIDKDKSIMMLAFNKHIANELKLKVPNSDKIRVSTTHALGWGAIRRKYKEAIIDDDKAFKVIRKKLPRWNLTDIDEIDRYVLTIKKLVDLCRVTITTRREFVILLAQRHGIQITDEDARRVLSVMEDMYNDTKTFDFIDMIYIPAIDKKIWLFPSDYVFVDECISGRNHILIKSNKTVMIKDLYDKHISPNGNLIKKMELPEVLSYNVETGRNEYKKIKNIYNKGKKSLTLVNLNGIYVLATPSHLFYTSEGWREVKDLKKGDLVIGNKYERELNAYSPDDEQMDFLFSYNICYGMTEYTKLRCKYRIYIKNSDKAKMKFISSITPLHVKSNKDHIKTTEFSTFKFYYNYDIFTKEYVIKNITDKQLAIVYFLSGKYFKDIDKFGFFISLKTFDEIVYAKELFERKFETIFDIKYYIKGSYLVPRDQDWFFNKISMYVPKIFKNLVPEIYHDQLEQYKYDTTRNHVPMSIVRYVIPDYKKENVYDLSVEGNYNYFVSSLESQYFRRTIKDLNIGYLVHNCQDYNRAQQFMLNKIIKKDTGRLISVGDEHQCQPEGAKVLMSDKSEKNIEDIVVGDRVVTYNRSECIESSIEEVANRVYNSNLIVVESNNKVSKYTDIHKCFVRLKESNIIIEVIANTIDKDSMDMVHYNNDIIEYYPIDKLYYEEYKGYVYSLKVEKYEAYVADGMLTHNSIYSFNGSDSDSFNWFRDRENTTELPLTTSFRSAKRIIELAQTLVPSIRYKHDAEDGEVINGSVLELAKAGDYVLARKNKPLVVLLFDLLRMDKTATIRGNDIGMKIAETVKKYKTIPELNEGLNTSLNNLRDNLINNFGVIDFRNDPRYVSLEDNIEIIRFLMGNSKSIERIIEKLSLIFTDKPEGIILSTIHKSKGLESDSVFIIRPDEIRLKTPIPEAAIQERNLEYIAYTRAKNRLIIDRDWTDERE
jgi:superfamily I DNA/RNA helicase